jgi:hypothetical protein
VRQECAARLEVPPGVDIIGDMPGHARQPFHQPAVLQRTGAEPRATECARRACAVLPPCRSRATPLTDSLVAGHEVRVETVRGAR